MRVAPGAPGEAVTVATGDVHAAQIAYFSVDDDHLAVVAEIGVGRKERDRQGDEGFDLDARFLEFAVEFAAGQVCQVVILHADGDAFRHLALEHCCDAQAGRIVLEFEEFEVDVVACKLHIPDQVVEHRVESQVGLERIPADRAGLVHLVYQSDEALVFAGHICGITGLRLAGQLLQGCTFFLGNEPPSTGSMPDQEVEHQSDYRQENDDQDPDQGLDRVLVLGDDVDDGPYQRQEKQDG